MEMLFKSFYLKDHIPGRFSRVKPAEKIQQVGENAVKTVIPVA
jgi:hypothetical protein